MRTDPDIIGYWDRWRDVCYDDLSKSVSRVSVLDGGVQSPQAVGLCADPDVRAQ